MHMPQRLLQSFVINTHSIPTMIPTQGEPTNNTRPSRALLQRPTRAASPPLMLHVRSAPRATPSDRFSLPRSRRIRRRGDVAPPRTHRQPVTAIARRRRHTAARRRHLRAGRRPHRATASDLLRPFDPARVAREVAHWVDAGAD